MGIEKNTAWSMNEDGMISFTTLSRFSKKTQSKPSTSLKAENMRLRAEVERLAAELAAADKRVRTAPSDANSSS